MSCLQNYSRSVLPQDSQDLWLVQVQPTPTPLSLSNTHLLSECVACGVSQVCPGPRPPCLSLHSWPVCRTASRRAGHQILLLIGHPSSAPRPPTPLADRAFSTFPSFGSVGAWLEALDLGRYKDSFTAAGYGSLEAVASMTAQ